MSSGVILALVGGIAGFWHLRRSLCRTSEDVLDDLGCDLQQEASKGTRSHQSPSAGEASYWVMRAMQRDAQGTPAAARREAALCIVLVPLALLLLRAVFGALTARGVILTVLIGAGIGYLVSEARRRRRADLWRRNLEFYLPMVMERLMMAVQAGHDVLAAIRVILDLEEQGSAIRDPVSRLLEAVYSLTESGVGLERSLQDVAAAVDCSAVKHAFVHLAQAHREGGELVMPLRELSDSTQLYYQESIEEEIAKLPVRATVPLILTFAGLMMFFLTAPLMQVLDITTKAMPK